MAKVYNSVPITSVARTITTLLELPAPKSAANPILPVMTAANMTDEKVNRVFLYNPDAIGLWLYQKYTNLFTKAIDRSTLQLPMLSVMPSVTPVCFASMYTGLMPDVHGISAYEKPVLQVETVFDVLIENGLKPAIVSTAGDSISEIFLQRDMDYFIFDNHYSCNEKALNLIERDEHDLIVLYNHNYDTTMHRHGVEAPESIAALRENIHTYATIHDAIKKYWAHHKTFIGFCPDHDCHQIDGNMGSHGLDMPEDMNVIHFYDCI